MLGSWLDQLTAAGLITRSMAIEAARVQLLARRDVIVPQYFGRIHFVVELEQLAHQTGAAFLEIALMSDAEDLMNACAVSPQPASVSRATCTRSAGSPGGAERSSTNSA